MGGHASDIDSGGQVVGVCNDFHTVGVQVVIRDSLRAGVENGRDVVLGSDMRGYRGGVRYEVFLDIALENLGAGG